MKWDLCKIKIREFCIQYSKRKKRSQRSRYLKLQEDLDKADAGLAADPQNSELLRHRERVKMEMEIYAVQEAKGTQTLSLIHIPSPRDSRKSRMPSSA